MQKDLTAKMKKSLSANMNQHPAFLKKDDAETLLKLKPRKNTL